MVSKKCIRPTISTAERRPSLSRLMEGADRQPPFDPAQRLALHKASLAHRGPDPGGTVRVTMRNKLPGGEAAIVRAMYDKTAKPKRRRRKETKS